MHAQMVHWGGMSRNDSLEWYKHKWFIGGGTGRNSPLGWYKQKCIVKVVQTEIMHLMVQGEMVLWYGVNRNV